MAISDSKWNDAGEQTHWRYFSNVPKQPVAKKKKVYVPDYSRIHQHLKINLPNPLKSQPRTYRMCST